MQRVRGTVCVDCLCAQHARGYVNCLNPWLAHISVMTSLLLEKNFTLLTDSYSALQCLHGNTLLTDSYVALQCLRGNMWSPRCQDLDHEH